MRVSQVYCGLLLLAGCSSRPGALTPPSFDPADAAEAAIEEYDQNGDGLLSKQELSQSAALSAVATDYDTDGDGNLSAQEIAAGLTLWQQGTIGARAVPAVVQLDGRPLVGATVRLVPAEFLGEGVVKGAAGESGPGGVTHLRMAAEDLPENAPNRPLVQPGLYRVEITHPSTQVPAKYNTQTTLGIEITSRNPGPQGVTWELSSK